MRKGSDNLSRSINRIIEALSSDHRAVVISLDVCGWSPNDICEKFMHHHRYILETTNVTGNYKIETLWDKIEVIINKRGWIKSANAKAGMFQGFTGSMDTMLHVHVAYFCISEGKRLGIIRQDEAAIVLAMIDDGVICLPFSGRRNIYSKREVSRIFF
ncbi:hypothetical protein GJ496_001588 [Pomphorhynchus laevis]|nr:hypothetical protein GJ496_001588 [Pomphorhynchus laevis]